MVCPHVNNTIMRKTVLTSGSFTKAGNLTAYNKFGERVHISAKQAENMKLTSENLTFPLYAVIDERTFSTLDAEGNPTQETFTRTQALSIFATNTDLVNAFVDEASLDVQIADGIRKASSAAGLSEESINQLVNATI